MAYSNTVFADRYELTELIASRDMTNLYKGLDLQTGQTVAVKVFSKHLSLDPGFVARFREEAQGTAGLSHANIARVYDYGSWDDSYFMVSEYIEGQDLAVYLAAHGPLPVPQALHVAAEVCAAVQSAHQVGLAHRDIKPENILLRYDGAVKVTDFGIARAITISGFTATEVALGTAHYFSPEQAKGEPPTSASDVYSIATVLFEMLSGRKPFEGSNPLVVALKHVNDEPPALRSLDPAIPEDVEALVQRNLSKHPEKRARNAGELGEAIHSLGAFRRGMGRYIVTEGGQPTPRRWLRLLVGGSLVVLSALAGIGVAYPEMWAPVGKLVSPMFAKQIQQTQYTPGLVGKSVADALRTTESMGLKLAITGERSDAQVPPGAIMEQDPPPGTPISKGGTLRVVVNRGATLVDVPDLHTASLNEANSRLTRAGLILGHVDERPSRAEDNGRVIEQNPNPGLKVPQGTSVDLVLGRAEPTPAPTIAPTEPMPGPSPTMPATSPTPTPTSTTVPPTATRTPPPASPTPQPTLTPTPAPPTPTAKPSASPTPAPPAPTVAPTSPAPSPTSPSVTTPQANGPGPSGGGGSNGEDKGGS